MEEKKSNYTWLWIVLAFILGLLLTCAVSAAVGGVAGYFAGQKAAQQTKPSEGSFKFHFEPRIPTPEEPKLPEALPPERFPKEVFGGALVVEVMPDSPAADAGLRPGDIIVAIDGKPLEDERSLADRIMEYEPGDEITLEITRGGRTRTIEVELGRHPDKGGRTPWLGIKYRAMPRLRIEIPRGD